MKIDLAIPGYTIAAAPDGQGCSGTYHSSDPAQAEIGRCPTNPIFAIYKAGSATADCRCWKHFREFISQNPTAVADIVIQLLLKEQLVS
jgi:hypothetical protein